MRRVLLLVWVTIAVACGSQSPAAPTTSNAGQLLAVPTTVVMAGRLFTLEGSAWRDFAPQIVAPGSTPSRPLNVVVDLRADDGTKMAPEAATAVGLAVVRGTDVWATDTLEIRTPSNGWRYYELWRETAPSGTSVRLWTLS